MKVAVIILSDPKGGEEALGRVFNALALASDARRNGDETELSFAGAGTRWPAELSNVSHPAHALYASVQPLVKGASCGCASVFGATDGVEACHVPMLTDNAIPGTPGLLSIRRYLDAGYQVLTF